MVEKIPFPYREVPKDLLLINSTSQFLIGLVVLVIGGLLFKKYLERRTKALLYVSLTYLAFGISVFIGSWQGLIAWWQYDNVSNPNPLVYGMPLFIYGLTWPFNAIAYLINMLSLMFLMLFVHSVFSRPERRIVIGFNALALAWILIFPIGNGIFIYVPTKQYEAGGSSVTFLGLVIFLLLGTFVHVMLALYANAARKREKDPVVRKGLALLTLAGLTVLLAYVVFVVNGLMKLNLDFIAWTVGTFAVIFVYLGFGMPEWFKNLLKRRYGRT